YPQGRETDRACQVARGCGSEAFGREAAAAGAEIDLTTGPMIGDDLPWRRLSDEEHELWRGITRSVIPLKRRRPQPVKSVQAERTAHRTVSALPTTLVRATENKLVSTSRIPLPPIKSKNPMPPPHLMQLDR